MIEKSFRVTPAVCFFRTDAHPERFFLKEILSQEGYASIECISLDGTLPFSELIAGQTLVLVSADRLLPSECETLKKLLHSGGRLILFKPNPDDLSSLGMSFSEARHPTYGEASQVWLKSHDTVCTDIVQIISFCDLYRLKAEKTLATVAPRREEISDYPAISELAIEEGRVIIWRFDLAESVLRLRQGDPLRASSGPLAGADGVKCFKPGSLFFGLIDPTMHEVPQADVMTDILVRQIREFTDDLTPLPRLWYYPDNAPAITLLDGDSDIYDWDSYAKLVAPALAAGIPYTLNLMEKHLKDLNRVELDTWIARGNDFELHVWPGSNSPDFDSMRSSVSEGQRLFFEKTGLYSVSTRHHTCVWPGYVESASYLAENGFRLETNYMPFRNTQYGYFGSGRPARFMTGSGEFIEISQQPTVLMDDPLSNNKSLLPAKSPEEVYEITTQIYSKSANKYHTAICTCIHPLTGKAFGERSALQDALLRAVIDGNKSHGMRALNLRAWSAFHEARRKIRMEYSDRTWKISSQDPITGITVLMPERNGSTVRQGVKWQSSTLNYHAGETKNIKRAASSGSHSPY